MPLRSEWPGSENVVPYDDDAGRVAVFLDFENLVFGAGQGLPGHHDPIPAKALAWLCRGFGNASIRRAYADWANPAFGRYQAALGTWVLTLPFSPLWDYPPSLIDPNNYQDQAAINPTWVSWAQRSEVIADATLKVGFAGLDAPACPRHTLPPELTYPATDHGVSRFLEELDRIEQHVADGTEIYNCPTPPCCDY